jgi:ribose transport system permease protein
MHAQRTGGRALIMPSLKRIDLQAFVAPVLISILLLVIGQLINPGFASIQNIGNLLAIAAILAIGAAGQTAVVISGGGGIDMSLGAMMSLGAVLGSGLLNGSDSRIVLALVVLLAFGAFFGFLNGAGIWWMKIPPLVMTLAIASVVDGFTLFVSQGRPFGAPSPFILAIGGGRIFVFLRWLVVIAIGIVVLFTLLLKRTRYGKRLFLIGNNRTAAELNGIHVRNVVLITYMLAGMMYSLAGLFLLSAVGTAQMQMGTQYTLLSVAAVVLGGTQLTGGKGTYLGTALGSIVLVTLTSVLITIGMASGVRLIITGIVLVGILAVYSRQPKLRQ